MKWFAQLTFAQAVRWALLWPAFIAATVLAAGAVVIATRWSGNWAFAFGVESHGPLPVWVAVTLGIAVVVVGPPVVFLALWRAARG